MVRCITIVLLLTSTLPAEGFRTNAKKMQTELHRQSCAGTCDTYFQNFGIATGCAMEECKPCGECSVSAGVVGDGSAVPRDGQRCGALYRERQTGLKCGLHATNAVLENIGLAKTTASEMDDVSELAGAESHGEDYDIAAIMALLMWNRETEVSSSGRLTEGLQPVTSLLAEVGRIDEAELAALPQSEREAYERQRRHVQFEDLPWLICNANGHWKTYFKAPETWCNLDSVPARQGLAAAEVQDAQMRELRCRAIIVPTR